MSQITDYASLKTAVGDWLVRSDISDSYIDYFIQVAEETIYDDVFAMNDGRGVRAIETALDGTIASGVLAVPADYLALKSAYISAGSNKYNLERKNAQFIRATYPDDGSTGIPTYIAREAANFIFGAYPDSNYSVRGIYWQKQTGLSSSNTSTWMITEIPTALLAACNAAASQFIKDSVEFQRWSGIYESLMQKFIARDRAEAHSGSALSISVG
jgi:hypothetical protein